MKNKIISLILSCALMLCFVGCEQNATTQDNNNSKAEPIGLYAAVITVAITQMPSS